MRSLKHTLIRVGPSWRTLLSAGLVAAAFPPWDFEVAWVALVPWLSDLKRRETWRQSVLQGLWLSLGIGCLAAHWIAYGIHEFLTVPWPFAILGAIVFAATAAQPHLLVFAPLFHWIARSPGGVLLGVRGLVVGVGLALGYSGLDWLVPRLFDVGLGYALHDATNLRQLGDLGGVPLLTCLIALVNLWVWQMLEPGPRSRGALLVHASAIAILCGAALAYGAVRNRGLSELQPDRTISAALVQGNVSNADRLAWARGDDRAAERQLSAYMLPTEELIAKSPRPDLVVWPEATFPGVFRQPMSRLQEGRAIKFDRQVLRLGVPIVFGAYDRSEESGRSVLYNTLFSITPSYDRPGRQGFVQRYRKHELLPFAETLPGFSEGGLLHRLLPSLGFFGRGPGAGVLRIATPDRRALTVSPILCSESLHAEHVIEGARQESDLILNVGSDGWFGPYGEPQFHLAISRLRSVETRLPQLRATNTGISALILPDGEIAARSALGVQQTLELEVPIARAPQTLMMAWGSWFGPSALALAAVFVLGDWLERRRAGARGPVR